MKSFLNYVEDALLTSIMINTLTLDYLCDYSFCRGARHGHRFSGKLARIAKQEALMLASMNSSTLPTSLPSKTSDSERIEESTDEPIQKKKKKNKKKTKECDVKLDEENCSGNEKEENETNSPKICHIDDEVAKSQKPKKKKKDRATPEDPVISVVTEDSYELKTKIKKKKKDKLVNENTDLPVVFTADEVKLKKSKKRKRNDAEL